MEFAERLKYLIDNKYKGKATTLAGVIGVSESNIRSYLSGTLPKINTVADIAKCCGVSCEWLLLGKGDMIITPGANVSATCGSQVAIGSNITQQEGSFAEEIKKLKSEIEHAKRELKQIEDTFKARIESYEREIQSMRETLKAKDELIEILKTSR